MYSPLISTDFGMPAAALSPLLVFLLVALPLSLWAGYWVFRRGSLVLADGSPWIPSVAVASLLFLFIALHVHYFPQSIDDSFISYRYSENLAHGQGLCYNPPERIEGFSNPLWVLILAGVSALGFDSYAGLYYIPLAAKLIGFICNLAIFGLILRWAVRGRSSWFALFIGLSWLVAAGANSLWALCGLETPLHSLLLVWVALSWSDLNSSGKLPARPVSLTLALLLLVLSRPEGALFGAVMLSLWWWADRRGDGTSSMAWKISAASWAALIVVVTLFRLSYFGDVLPNTFYAKAGGSLLFRLRHGAQYLAVALLSTGGWNWMLSLWHTRRESLRYAAPLVLLAAQAVFILYVGGDWMMGFRFLAPVIPLGVISLIQVMNRHARRFRVWIPATRTSRALALVFVLLVITAFQAAAFDRILFFQTDYFVSGFQRLDLFPEVELYDAAQAVRNAAAPGDVLAISEAGLIPYVSGVHTLDVHGLTDRTIAAKDGLMHRKATVEDILGRSPNLLILKSVSVIPDTTATLAGRLFVDGIPLCREFTSQYKVIYRNPGYVLFKRHADSMQ